MKTYSIGRDLNCDIVINDSTDIISRRHALLNVTPSGKMTLIDQSSNGTYVNGIRISQNVPVPVTRKDVISLAHVAKLDWNQIPKSNQWLTYIIGGLVVIGIALAIIFGVKSKPKDEVDGPSGNVVEVVDSTAIKQKEAARLDSIKNVERQDSINKAKKAAAAQDSTKVKKPVSTPKKKENTGKQKGEDKSKDKKIKDKSSTSRKRPIGN